MAFGSFDLDRKRQESTYHQPNQESVLRTSDLPTIGHVLEDTALALILVDGRRQLRFTNETARGYLSQGDAIMLDSGNTLRCRDRKTQMRFDQLISAACSASPQEWHSKSGTLAVPRRDGGPLAARVTPASNVAGDRSNPEVLNQSRVVVFLWDPTREFRDHKQDLTTVFGLTIAEAQVVELLTAGLSLQHIAEERSVSLVTIRNQLKSAQSKIGVRRQAELVSVVLRTLHV